MSDPLPLFIDLLIRSTSLVLFAWAIIAMLRKGGVSAAMRHLVWLCAIAGLVLLPLLAVTMPALQLAILPEVATPPLAAVMATDARPIVAESAPAASAPSLLLYFYLAIAGGMLAWLLTAQRTLTRIWLDSEPANAAWTELLSRAAADLRLREHVELRLARDSVMPMTWGTRRPKILLPAEARDWTSARRRLVLLHELGHVRRRDSLTQIIAAIVRALCWFQPGAWFAAQQLRLEQELAADDLALGAGAPPNRYARNLLDLACAFCLPAPAMARRSQLERRLTAIVRPTSRRVPGLAFGAIAVSLVLAATWLSATATAIPVASATVAGPALATMDGESLSGTLPTPAAADGEVMTAARPASRKPHRAAAVPAKPAFPATSTVALVQAVAPAESKPARDYATALARYRLEKVEYEGDVREYRIKRADYRSDVEQYRRNLAEHRQRVEAVHALPDGDPGKVFPNAPVVPVTPVPPTPPVVPPVPPDLNHS